MTPRNLHLAMARQNTALLLAFVYMQDIFWLLVSRAYMSYSQPVYMISTWEWVLFGLFTCIAIIFALIGVVLVHYIKPLPKIGCHMLLINSLLVFACFGNLLIMSFVSVDARYTSGGLVGTAGIIYGIFRGVGLGAMILILRMSSVRRPVPLWLIMAFTLTFALTLDGFASALTLVMFLAIYLPMHRSGKQVIVVWLILFCLGSVAAYLALVAKWGQLLDHMDSTFFLNWVIPRFSVQAESMYSFVAGNLQIQGGAEFMQLVLRAIGDRMDIILGNPKSLEYPRSVSESVYNDVYGGFGAGSSPGALLGSAMMGPLFFWFGPMILGFLFFQMFYYWPVRVSLVVVCALSFLLKALHADLSEYFTIVSPTLMYVACFLLACLLFPKESPVSRT